MNRGTPAPTASVAVFGDIEAGLWGVLLAGEQPRLAFGSLDWTEEGPQLHPAALDRDGDDVWSVSGEGAVLRLEKALATTSTPEQDLPLQPLRVTGSVRVGDDTQEIDIGGVLAQVQLNGEVGSLRLIGSWFPAGRQVGLLATRPRSAKGHDRDSVSVVALGEEAPLVFDPRLSTTYDADGAPRRAGVEIWLGAQEEEDQFPLRVAGVPTGAGINDSEIGMSLAVAALRCVSRGADGVGVYALLRAA